MADYYPVLKRAISSLPSSSGEARRAVYEKARQALLRQLQSYDPPLSPGDVTTQRLQLEESIRRVESEVAGAAFGLTPEPVPAAPPPPPAPPPAPAAKMEPAPPEPAAAEGAGRAPEPPPPPAVPDEPVRGEAPPVVMDEPRGEQRRVKEKPVKAKPASVEAEERASGKATLKITVPVPTPKAGRVDRRPGEAAGEPTIGSGVDVLQQTLRQAENLGEASAEAVRKARGAIEDETEVSAAPAVKVEPGFMSAPLGAPQMEPAIEPPVRQRPMPREVTVPPAVLKAPARPTRTRLAVASVAGLLLIAGAALAYVQRDRIAGLFGEDAAAPTLDEVAAGQPADAGSQDALEPKILDRLPQNGEAPPAAPDAKAVTTERVAAAESEPGTPPPPGDIALATPPADASAPVETPAVPDAGTPPGTETPPVSGEPSTEPPPAAIEPPPATATTSEPAPGDQPTDPATTDVAAAAPAANAGAGTAPAAGAPAVIVAQRAILYEEPIPGSEGARVEGQVLWTLVNEPVLPGEPPVAQIRASVEVPDRKIKLVLSLRRNTDQALPASHIAELRFDLPPDFQGRGIDTTPGLILKQTEDARGDPLIGAVAKVSDNLFWLALSAADQDGARNIGLLKEREWIDVPIRYLNRRRAILTFEKGTPGTQVFQQALQSWGQ